MQRIVSLAPFFQVHYTYLGNLSPAVSGISHLLQSQLLLRGPGRVGPALLSGRRHGSGSGVCVLGRSRRWLRRRSGLRSGRRGRRRLTLDRGHGRWSGGRGGRRGSILSRSLPRTGIRRLDRGLLSRRLLLGRRAIWRLLRYAHGRLDWRWVVLLLRSHVGLGAVGKLHALLLVATHIGRVRMVTVRGTPVSRLAGGGGESSRHDMELCMV